jgi:hypothetical protein
MLTRNIGLHAAVASVLLVVLATPVVGATVLGNNFDSNMSVIYDSVTGNIYLENAVLSNPAVQQLQIASAGGLLLPGNLNVPALSPTVTVSSATSNLIDISWAPGNFLGTGSFLGNILGASISQPTLLADLTIGWAPFSSSLVGGDLLYGTFGNTAGNPVLPNSGSNGFFRFFNVNSGQFMDPPIADGFEYQMTDGALFTKIGLPTGYGNNFTVVVGGNPVATGLAGGDAYTFGGPGVPSFQLIGLNPDVDAANPDAFPLYMEFNQPTASFNMTAIVVPEPSTFVLAILGLSGVGLWGRRRSR